MMILNKTYGFGEGGLVAPQANAMAAVIEPLMGGTGAPWLLYGIGAMIAIVLTLCRVPALAFALGMFIPMSLDVPLLIGGLVAWYVSTRSKDKAVNTARSEKGTLVASGFIAGGALMGVVSAIIKFGGLDLTIPHWNTSAGGQWLSLVAYGALIGFFIWFVLRNKKEKQ